MSRTIELTNSTTLGLLAQHFLSDDATDKFGRQEPNAAYRLVACRQNLFAIACDNIVKAAGLLRGPFPLASHGASVLRTDVVCTYAPSFSLQASFSISDTQGWTNQVAVAAEVMPVFAIDNTSNAESARRELKRALDRVISELSGAEIVSVNAAVIEAVHQLGKLRYTQQPRFSVSDEGAVMVQWRSADRGLMLVFCGDGRVTFSEKSPGGYYMSKPRDFLVGELPISEFDEAIARVLS